MLKWLFSEDAFVKELPLRRQKMPANVELRQRELIHGFLIQLGSKLKLDGRTILAATIYANRYYMKIPITQSKYFVALAAVAISCKLHENYRQPGKIALAAANLKQAPNNPVVDEQNDQFWKWRDQLLYREELILKTLNFDLNLDFPYDIRDAILEAQEGKDIDDEFLIEPDMMKLAMTLVEILSSLPVFVAFDSYTILGLALIIVHHENNTPLPQAWLQSTMEVTGEMCLQCYKYIQRLLKYCISDPQMILNKNVTKRLPQLDDAVFLGQ